SNRYGGSLLFGVVSLAVGVGLGGLLSAEAGQPLGRVVGQLVLHRGETPLAAEQFQRRHGGGTGQGGLQRLVGIGSRAGRNQLAGDHVLRQTAREVRLGLAGGVGESRGRRLEGGCRQPRVRGQRRLGDTHQLG